MADLVRPGSLWNAEVAEAMRRRRPSEDDGEDEQAFARSSWGNDWLREEDLT